MKHLPNLPVGESSFKTIRENQNIYVDKTRHIFRIIDEGKYYFLSRPRRFGKSLTISTLKCLFQGKQDLFTDLWIEKNTEWEWKEYPVILIDFNQISHDTPNSFKLGLESSLKNLGRLYGVQLRESLLKEQFKELILSLYQKTGMPVVILMDEYDKPLIDHLGRGEDALQIAMANRDILRYFMGVIKGGDVVPVLRFVFITGVSSFSQVSIFSELNNLDDLTMSESCADMFGYTREELESYFMPYIRQLARKAGTSEAQVMQALASYYNGYRFSKRDVRVYNPFSVLTALKRKKIANYWFKTGTPTFLINLLHEADWYLPDIENMQATEGLFSVYDIEHLQIEALLFQTGYVTIKEIRGNLYNFGYPNQEVKTAFLENLFRSYTPNVRGSSRFAMLSDYLQINDLNNFIETVKAIYASIPYTLEIQRDEAYFHTLFYLMVSASGVKTQSEVLTCKGRIDLLMEFDDKVFIIEFKCNQSADKALQQIKGKRYADPYRQTGKKIVLMGINFNTEEHNIIEWQYELMS